MKLEHRKSVQAFSLSRSTAIVNPSKGNLSASAGLLGGNIIENESKTNK